MDPGLVFSRPPRKRSISSPCVSHLRDRRDLWKIFLLWAGLGSFPKDGCLEKSFEHTHKPPLFFLFFFLVHKPFPVCRDTPAWLWWMEDEAFQAPEPAGSWDFTTGRTDPRSHLWIHEVKRGKRPKLNPPKIRVPQICSLAWPRVMPNESLLWIWSQI